MLESILSAAIFEAGKESAYVLFRSLQPSDFARVGQRMLSILLIKHRHQKPVNADRLVLFFERPEIARQLDKFREEYTPLDLRVIEAEFKAEFRDDFETSFLNLLAREFSENFEKSLIAALPEVIGVVLARIANAEEKTAAQHAQLEQRLYRIETKIDEVPHKIAVEQTKGLSGTEAVVGSQVTTHGSTSTTLIQQNPTPYLQRTEGAEKDLPYKLAFEKRLKRRLDVAVNLIQRYQLNRAQSLLKKLRGEIAELLDPSEIDAGLRSDVYRLLGICLLRQQKVEPAFENFEMAKTITGETEKLKKVFLEFYVATRDYESAAKLAQNLLAENPGLLDAKNTLAIILLRERRFEEILRFYEAEQQADQDATAQNILAIAYLELRKLSLALQSARKLVELEPYAPRAYETLGNVFLVQAYAPLQSQLELQLAWAREIVDKENLRNAITNYQKALELYSNSGQHALSGTARINLASALTSDGRPADALDLISINFKMISEAPDVETFLLKARLEDELGKPDLAIETCLQALQVFPTDYRLLEVIGGLHLNNKEPEIARDWLKKAEEVCSTPEGFAELKILGSKTYLFQDNSQEAWRCLQDIPVTERNKPNILLAYGDYFFHSKNYTEAERYYVKALNRAPDNLGLLDSLVKFHISLQQPEKALKYAERVLQRAATPIAYGKYAELLLLSGKSLDASKVLQKARRQEFDLPIFKRQEANCKQQLGQFLDAAKLYEEYLTLNPEDFAATYNLGVCYYKVGRRPEAIAALKKAEILSPNDALVHTSLAEVYHIEEEKEKAYYHARRALDLSPDNPDTYLFFFQTAFSCGYEEQAVNVLMTVPERFPTYEHLKAVDLPEARDLLITARKRFDQAINFYRSGNVPLPFIASWLGKPLPLVWRILSDDETEQILCSMGDFEEQGLSHVTATQAERVVIDYCALVTLHHLRLIDLPSKIFEQVYVAQGVFDQLQKDIAFLVDSLPSRQLERLEAISRLVYQTPVINRQTEWLENTLVLDVRQADDIRPVDVQDILLAKQNNALYLLDNSSIFSSVAQVLPAQVTSTKKLLDYFFQNGKLPQSDYYRACDYLDRTSNLHDFGVDDVGHFKALVIDYLTLEIIYDLEIFHLLLNEFEVIYLSQPTLFLLTDRIREFEFKQDLLKSLRKVETAVRDIYTLDAPVVDGTEHYPDYDRGDATVTQTFILADKLQLPIWTDDLASRKLIKSGEWGKIATFDTRTALNVAVSKKQLSQDDSFRSVLSLLKWNYYFIPVNAPLLFWSTQQRNFRFNEDTALLMTSLDRSVKDAYHGLKRVEESLTESSDLSQLDAQIALFIANLKVYADFVLQLWQNLPPEYKGMRSKWTLTIIRQVFEALDSSVFETNLFLSLCISNMLGTLETRRLGEFILLCDSPFTLHFLPDQSADEAVVRVLFYSLYRKEPYSDRHVQSAAKLLDSLRYAQYDRIMKLLQKTSSEHQGVRNFFNAVQVKRYGTREAVNAYGT